LRPPSGAGGGRRQDVGAGGPLAARPGRRADRHQPDARPRRRARQAVRRRGRPLFLLDIAVPRDVEPEVSSLDGIYLADIDDLQKVAAEHRDERKSEADGAEAIVAQELDRFLKAWRGRLLGNG